MAPAIYRQWQEVNHGQARTIFFSSPVRFSGLSVNYEADDRPGLSVCLTEIPLGTPRSGVVARLLDSGGHLLPPGYPGQLTIQLHDHAEKFTAAAWRDKSGVIHLIPSDDKLVEQLLTEIAGVRDAHCLTMAASAKTSRHAWLILQDRGLHVSEAIQNAIASLPRTLQPDYVHAISEFPLTAGGRIDSAKLQRSLTDVQTKTSHKVHPADSVAWQPLLLLHTTPNAPALFLVMTSTGVLKSRENLLPCLLKIGHSSEQQLARTRGTSRMPPNSGKRGGRLG